MSFRDGHAKTCAIVEFDNPTRPCTCGTRSVLKSERADRLREAWRKRIAKFQETQHQTYSTDRDQGEEDLISDIIAQRP